MDHILVKLMSELTTLSAEEKEDIKKSAPIKTFSKGSYLIKEGQIAKDSYYVIEGCIREYELIDGEEKTTAFFTEHQSAVNFKSLIHQIPSTKNFICLESTTLAILNTEKEDALYRKYPRFEQFCRKGMEQMMGGLQEQFAEFINLSPEERYRKLQRERPGLLNRVPQYQIASYLGIKPETLSRIRKRLRKND